MHKSSYKKQQQSNKWNWIKQGGSINADSFQVNLFKYVMTLFMLERNKKNQSLLEKKSSIQEWLKLNLQRLATLCTFPFAWIAIVHYQ